MRLIPASGTKPFLKFLPELFERFKALLQLFSIEVFRRDLSGV
jgi:hypothetical protein